MIRIHVALHTHDLDAAQQFYAALFGEPADKVHEDHVRFQPADLPLTLTLMPGTPEPGPDHLGLKFADPSLAKAAWARLTEAGIVLQTEEDVTCCWATSNKVWTADPDGRAWEVYTVVDDAPGTRDGVEATPAACCA